MHRSAWYVLLVALAVYLAPRAALAQTATDRDGDGVPDSADNCSAWPNPGQADADGNGIGDDCECGDQDGNGHVDVRDLVAINLAIFNPAQATPLCDTNYDGLCSVGDIVGASARIFGRPAYCERHPPDPTQVDGDGDGFSPAEGDCDDTRASIAPEPSPIDPNALAPVVSGACEDGPFTPSDCNAGTCFDARGPFRDFRETDGCSNPVAIDPNNPSGPSLCPAAAFATGISADPRGCDLHDFCYRTCGSSKSECDQQQLKNHLAICESLPSSQFLCLEPCRTWAHAYFETVQNVAAAQEAWTRNQGLYCSCCGGGECGDGVCEPAAGERPRSCPQDCPPAAVGSDCVVDADCASGQCSFSGRCIECGNGVCEAGEFCGVSPGCRDDCGLCAEGSMCRNDADCSSGFCDLGLGFCKPCQGNGAICVRDAACCDDVCNNAFLCASCKDPGQFCLTDGVCCSGLCNGAFVCSNCKTLGGTCSVDRDCCSGNCGFLGLCGL